MVVWRTVYRLGAADSTFLDRAVTSPKRQECHDQNVQDNAENQPKRWISSGLLRVDIPCDSEDCACGDNDQPKAIIHDLSCPLATRLGCLDRRPCCAYTAWVQSITNAPTNAPMSDWTLSMAFRNDSSFEYPAPTESIERLPQLVWRPGFRHFSSKLSRVEIRPAN